MGLREGLDNSMVEGLLFNNHQELPSLGGGHNILQPSFNPSQRAFSEPQSRATINELSHDDLVNNNNGGGSLEGGNYGEIGNLSRGNSNQGYSIKGMEFALGGGNMDNVDSMFALNPDSSSFNMNLFGGIEDTPESLNDDHGMIGLDGLGSLQELNMNTLHLDSLHLDSMERSTLGSGGGSSTIGGSLGGEMLEGDRSPLFMRRSGRSDNDLKLKELEEKLKIAEIEVERWKGKYESLRAENESLKRMVNNNSSQGQSQSQGQMKQVIGQQASPMVYPPHSNQSNQGPWLCKV